MLFAVRDRCKQIVCITFVGNEKMLMSTFRLRGLETCKRVFKIVAQEKTKFPTLLDLCQYDSSDLIAKIIRGSKKDCKLPPIESYIPKDLLPTILYKYILRYNIYNEYAASETIGQTKFTKRRFSDKTTHGIFLNYLLKR